MFFLSSSDFNPSTRAGSESASVGVLVCPPIYWATSHQVESWSAIYRIAYEQLMAAFAPSPFQRMIEPSAN
jgi:hypothetical protein